MKISILIAFLGMVGILQSQAQVPGSELPPPTPPPVKNPLFIPYIGAADFPTSTTYTVDRSLTIPMYQGLPGRPYTVIGDIYVPDRPTAGRAIADGVRFAASKGADAVIIASGKEIADEQVKGNGRIDPAKHYFQAWAIRWTGKARQTLPEPTATEQNLENRPVELTGMSQDGNPTPQSAAAADEEQRELTQELAHNALKIRQAKEGIVPQGYTQARYIYHLRYIQAQIIQQMKEDN